METTVIPIESFAATYDGGRPCKVVGIDLSGIHPAFLIVVTEPGGRTYIDQTREVNTTAGR